MDDNELKFPIVILIICTILQVAAVMFIVLFQIFGTDYSATTDVSSEEELMRILSIDDDFMPMESSAADDREKLFDNEATQSVGFADSEIADGVSLKMTDAEPEADFAKTEDMPSDAGEEVSTKTNESVILTFDSETASSSEAEVEKTITEDAPYILNSNSGKIHKRSCSSVSKIKPENVKEIFDLASALNDGNEPCGKCKPSL